MPKKLHLDPCYSLFLKHSSQIFLAHPVHFSTLSPNFTSYGNPFWHAPVTNTHSPYTSLFLVAPVQMSFTFALAHKRVEARWIITNPFPPKVCAQPAKRWVTASWTFVCKGEPSESPGVSNLGHRLMYPMPFFLLSILSHFQKRIIYFSFFYKLFQNFRFPFCPWVLQ